ncbi:MAG: DegT/DnrJ/EryC1/StrS family aminotransferase [Candidatus Hodarchaeales archaeon]|jgi:dTDP-4-amino-4,6-dideoxygalactose transaminase
MEKEIPLFRIHFDDEDIKAVGNIIKSGKNWAIGSAVSNFEKKIAEYLGCRYCVVFNSGTSALHAIMLAYNFHNGHEIIVPSFTFIATANSPLFVQAKPVFADIEPKTLGLDPESVADKITTKTKAIIPVHYGGFPAQIVALKELKLDGQQTGTFGDSNMLSFCQNKVITTGEGGAIVTDSEDIYKKLNLIRSHGRQDDKAYFNSAVSGNYIKLGYNLRMSNIIAALGLAQLAKVENIISKRIKVANYYIEKLRNLDKIVLPATPPNIRQVFQLFSIRVKNGFRDELIDFLKSKGIMSKIYFSPVHLTHFYKEVLGYKVQLPITESISQEILSLPMYPTMTEEEQNYVIETIKRFFEVKSAGENE